MFIGELSKITGASRKAIRHYEELGLIPLPQRQGKYRVYGEAEASLICMIRRAQSLGFTLKEIRALSIARAKTNRLPVDMALTLIDGKRDELKAAIARAKALDEELGKLRKDLLRLASSEQA